MLYLLKTEPSPGAFCDIFDHAVDRCGFAVAVVRPLSRMSPRGEEVLKRLEPFLAEKKVSNKRPGSKVLAENALLYKYKYGAPFSDAVQELNDHLYNWLQPNFPEDICLLRENEEPWFVSCSNKKVSYFSLAEPEKNELVQKIPEMGRILMRDKSED